MRNRFVVSSLAMVLTTVLFSSSSRAEISAAAFGGLGLQGSPGDDLMGLGVGARAGYTLLLPVYLGLAASVHQGTHDDEPNAPNNSMDYYGAEVGYQLELGSFGIRPYLMGGVANVTTTRDANGGFLSPYWGAGVTPYWKFLDLPMLALFVGLDVRYLQTTTMIDNGDNRSPAMALPAYLTLGASFL